MVWLYYKSKIVGAIGYFRADPTSTTKFGDFPPLQRTDNNCEWGRRDGLLIKRKESWYLLVSDLMNL